jgi:hypothetical protein
MRSTRRSRDRTADPYRPADSVLHIPISGSSDLFDTLRPLLAAYFPVPLV